MNIQLHTPGPWYVGTQQRIESLNNGKGGCLLVVAERGVSGRSWEEAQANAVLIAKAPELLAERDRFRETFRRCLAQRNALRQTLNDIEFMLTKVKPFDHRRAFQIIQTSLKQTQDSLL